MANVKWSEFNVLSDTGTALEQVGLQGVGNVRVGGAEAVTTGAAPVDANNLKTLTVVTSGGTADIEQIVLPDFTLDGNGVNAARNGTIHVVQLGTQTDPDDDVRVFPGVVGGFNFYDISGEGVGQVDEGVVLSEGETATFIWYDYQWFWQNYSYNNDTTILNQVHYVPSLGDPRRQQVLIGDGSSGNVFWTGDLGTTSTFYYLTTGVDPVNYPPPFHQIYITTGGTAGTEEINSVVPPYLDFVGAQQLIRIGTQTNPADVVSIDDPANYIRNSDGSVVTSITFDAVDEYLLIEAYDATTWRIVSGTATVTPAIIPPPASVSVTDAGQGNIVVDPTPGTGTFTLDLAPQLTGVSQIQGTGNDGITILGAPGPSPGFEGSTALVYGGHGANNTGATSGRGGFAILAAGAVGSLFWQRVTAETSLLATAIVVMVVISISIQDQRAPQAALVLQDGVVWCLCKFQA